jgi:hypothetical protein
MAPAALAAVLVAAQVGALRSLVHHTPTTSTPCPIKAKSERTTYPESLQIHQLASLIPGRADTTLNQAIALCRKGICVMCCASNHAKGPKSCPSANATEAIHAQVSSLLADRAKIKYARKSGGAEAGATVDDALGLPPPQQFSLELESMEWESSVTAAAGSPNAAAAPFLTHAIWFWGCFWFFGFFCNGLSSQLRTFTAPPPAVPSAAHSKGQVFHPTTCDLFTGNDGLDRFLDVIRLSKPHYESWKATFGVPEGDLGGNCGDLELPQGPPTVNSRSSSGAQ